MKTKSFVRRILIIRVVVFCLAAVGMAVIGFSLGESLTVRSGQTTGLRTSGPQAPNVSLADAMAAAQY